MKKIESFTIDHLKLLPGIYVSRKDKIDNVTLTTFDIRVTRPNVEPVMENGEIHTIEHLVATFLRSHELWQDKVIYFGPMGCRTGFYLILAGDLKSDDIFELMKETFDFVLTFEGEIPGATDIECGNYQDHNLAKAKLSAEKFKQEVLITKDEKRLNYPTI